MFVSVTSVLCVYNVVSKTSLFIIHHSIANYLPARVGLCEWKKTNVHVILTVMFKNVLRTFEADVLKILTSKEETFL